MIQKTFLTFLALLCLSSVTAQTFDLTTGTTALGTIDPIWTVENVTTGDVGPAIVTTGVPIQNGNLFDPNPYAQDPCGAWITPDEYVDANFNLTDNATVGDFVYRMTFDIAPSCSNNPIAALNMSFIAADDVVKEILVNGVPVQLPVNPIALDPPASITATPDVNVGTNVIEVVVENYVVFSGLQICGEIVVTEGPLPTPENLSCCAINSGEVLSWDPVPSATSYEVTINWNDPECCSSGLTPTSETFITQQNAFILNNPTECHSWQVRAISNLGCDSEDSQKLCGCAVIPNSCPAPTNLSCRVQGNTQRLEWDNISPFDTYEVELTLDDPNCCNSEAAGDIISQTVNANFWILGQQNGGRCFSWRVRRICADGSLSDWSNRECSCRPESTSNRTANPSVKIGIDLVPNPATEIIDIKVDDPKQNIDGHTFEVSIVDLASGEVERLPVSCDKYTRVDVTKYKPGMYICYIYRNGELIGADKMIIE